MPTLPLLGVWVTLPAHPSGKEMWVPYLFVHLCSSPWTVNAQAGEKVPHEFKCTDKSELWVPACCGPHCRPTSPRAGSSRCRMGRLLSLSEAEVWCQRGGLWQCQTRLWQSAVSTHRSLPPVRNSHVAFILFSTPFSYLLQIPFEVAWFPFNPAGAGFPFQQEQFWANALQTPLGI